MNDTLELPKPTPINDYMVKSGTPYQLTVRAKGYLPHKLDVTVNAGEKRQLNVRLVPAGMVKRTHCPVPSRTKPSAHSLQVAPAKPGLHVHAGTARADEQATGGDRAGLDTSHPPAGVPLAEAPSALAGARLFAVPHPFVEIGVQFLHGATDILAEWHAASAQFAMPFQER